MAFLSVIVPIYNSGKYLEKCIKSIQEQSLKDIEIILVDDGSKDNSVDICKSMSMDDNRIKVIQKAHTGPIETRKMGLKQSKAEYITFVDSDDWIENNSYMELLPYMNEGVDVIKFLMMQDEENGESFPNRNSYEAGTYDKFRIEKEIFPTMIWDIKRNRKGISSSLCDKIIRKEILEKSFGLVDDLHYHYCEDSTIVFPMYRWVESLVVTELILYHHCKHKENGNEYIESDSFFDDLYKWYKHLSLNVDYYSGFKRQIEEIYVAAMEPRLLLYGDKPDRIRNIFPFKKVKEGTRIVMWGNGVVGKTYKEQIEKTDYCKIICIVDKSWDKHDDEAKNPECIKMLEWDYIVISVHKETIRLEIEKTLLKWGIPQESIVW